MTESKMSDILSVDLLRYETGNAAQRRDVVDAVTKSLETGFVYCAHDMPAEVIDRAYELLATFFHLDRDVKLGFMVPGSMGQTGYTGLLVETAAISDTPDWKEMLNWGIELPDGHPLVRKFPHRYMKRGFPDDVVPGIGDALSSLYDTLLDLQRRVLRIVAEGLGVHAHYFDGCLKDGPTLCRALRYPPMDEAPEGDHVWSEEHADINLITALPRATTKGLQVKIGETWVDAVPPDGHAIINTGMMLERVSNGRIPSGIHRVVADPSLRGERYSVVQFCHPTPWTILSPVPSCIDANHLQQHPPIQAGDWLDQVLYDINLLEGARRA